jgi:trehalose synthase-fused probable maltokinase
MTDATSDLLGLPEWQLLEFVRRQRWFGAKTLEPTGAQLIDHAVLREEPRLSDALVEIRYSTGNRDVYQLLLGEGECEMVADPALAHALVRLVRDGARLKTANGQIEFDRVGVIPQDEPLESVRVLGLEQSNSSLVVDERLFVKLYRRLEAGVNPELEMLRFLDSHGFTHTAPLLGSWEYAGQLMRVTLGIVQQFVPGAIDGWSLAVGQLRDDSGTFLARVRGLGEVIGEMHVVLSSDSDDPVFSPEDASSESLALLVATVDDDIDQVFMHLPADDTVAPILGRGDAVRDLLRSLTTVGTVGRRIRHHGDLHLGQMLWANGEWLVIDFEGEPARPLPERRNKRSPLRDVAGMLRSITYAVAVAGVGQSGIEERARAEFLAGYDGAVYGTGLLPSVDATERLLRIFEIEKAVYELRYELAHRPDWVAVPVAGIVRLLEQAA